MLRRCALWLYYLEHSDSGFLIYVMATTFLSDLMKEHPEHRAEARQDLQFLNAQKLGDHEAEIEKIKNGFLSILRDIKKDIDSGEQPGETATAAMLQTMQEAVKDHAKGVSI